MGSYILSESVRTELADKLFAYYTDAVDEGVRNLMDGLARSRMGAVTAYLDVARDGWASLSAESRDKFTVKFEAEIRHQAALAYAGWPDLVADAIPQAMNAVKSLCDKIPIPLVGSAVAGLMELAAGVAIDELREKAMADADARVASMSGGSVDNLPRKPEDIQQSVAAAVEQYKTIGQLITTMPGALTTFQDVVTFPRSVFKVRKAASALNRELYAIRVYVDAMSTRLAAVEEVYTVYRTQLKTKLPEAVDTVLESAYQAGYQKGTLTYRTGGYKPIGVPSLKAPSQPGGATHLAAHVAYANAQGYFDVGQYEQVNMRRGRASAVSTPPPPPAASSGAPGRRGSVSAPPLPGGITPRGR